ncbi:unnamed protein product [Nezara viridula]|uniref:Uncharacterized protein n=1 Tax=Nezara viridula TaxID=85310 RepID=A0A9P0E7A4_NEZVI|nr:unnamed protein product [Nezara viridula]
MILDSIMWIKEIRDSKFPYAVNNDVEADNILFKNSPERLVLLKWIYTLTSGFLNDIPPGELADYFLNIGIVEGDSFEFVEGKSPKHHQKKVWSNLFRFAKMMKYSPEISQRFTEKYCDIMPLSCVLADEHPSTSTKTESSLFEPEIPNFDNIICTLEEQVAKPVVTSSEENKIVLCKLKEYLNRLSLINGKISSPESLNVIKDQYEFGHHTADLYKNMQTLENVLMSSGNVISSMRQLEKTLDDRLSKSEDTLEFVSKLKKFS